MPKDQEERLAELFRFNPVNPPDPAHLLRLLMEFSEEQQKEEIINASLNLVKSTLQNYVTFIDQIQTIRTRKSPDCCILAAEYNGHSPLQGARITW